jgi:hypothetical protein
MKILLSSIIILLLIILVPLAFLGLLPGISEAIGAGPKDLGIKITSQDSQAARDKVGTEIVALPRGTNPTDDYRLEGEKAADFTMDSVELTAHSNNRPWKNYPVKNIQIKIHDDGTIEGSGTLITDKAIPYAMSLGYNEIQIRDAIQKYQIPPFAVPFYIKGKGSVLNDKVSVNAENVQIGLIPIPGSIISQANTEAERVLEDIISKHSQSFHAESVTFTDGKMFFKGQNALKEYVATE